MRVFHYYYFIPFSGYSKDDFSDKLENYLLLGFSSDVLLHFYSQHPSQCLTFLASVNLTCQILCFSYTAYPLPVIVWRIYLDNFEKLSMLLGFSRDILEG